MSADQTTATTTATTTARPSGAEPSSSPRRLLEKLSPVSGARLGEFPVAGEDEVRAAVARARAAFPGWRDTPLAVRAEALGRVKQVLAEQGEHYARKISEDTGKPTFEATMTEIGAVPVLLDYILRRAPVLLRRRKVSTPIILPGKSGFIEYFPRGVIGIISPWNFPFQLAVVPVLSALIGGNTVVLKQSEITPIVAGVVEDLFRRIGLPAGVVEIVHGDGSTGAALTRADVDMLFFTGSVATGRKVMAAAAQRPIPVELELGGKDAMIVCADANLERAAEAAVWGGLVNCGQACVSVERIFVVDAIHDHFVEKVREKVSQVTVGGPDEQADMGPLTSSAQLGIVERHVKSAVAAGAKVVFGGERLQRPGQFFAPTLLTGITPEMEIFREETFGPVLPVVRVRDEEEAVRLANASEFGLAGSVWTQDVAKGLRLASRLECGQVCINDVIQSVGHPALPFGGVRSSGIGRYHGDEGILAFMNTRGIMVDRGKLNSEPLWYPYAGKVAHGFELLRGITTRSVGSLVKGFLGLRKKMTRQK
ncbi:aldehyde dehydrogenase family protein [Nannocystis radixulma]|uniref:Aldehyde dehydrogenase n=1 Tax=Nannocystis radixulma TaxID=2995305 RepID=A0ABT5B0L5_9BACT|nr:aldehyde dehydrogenase family protein [Nannocystis radixulma]MDC0667637.1 aldehyde dehydrogenase family protein [Nannocystis radixulma]